MNRKVNYLRVLVGFLVLLMAAPPGGLAQSSGTGGAIRQEELDQMLAPIALYPDSLLGQILVAATYPDQVKEADQWVNQNKSLQGDELNSALDRMDWDLSVKALVPFPQVLSMMSDKMEWTQKMGEAFLAQEAEVMDTIQSLRAKARAQGNLNSTEQQKVVVRGESIEIEPANPRVIYVPTYNPTVIYGSWWYPSYPPYAYNPYYPNYAYDPYYSGAGFVTAGLFGFAAGIAVGSVWNSGWGRWDWGRRNVNVNINRTININRNNINRRDIRTTSWSTVRRQRGSIRSGRDVVGQPGSRGTVGRAAVKAGARPSAASVQQGLQQRSGKAQLRQGKNVGQASQTRMRSGPGQRGSAMSAERSKGQRGSAMSAERSKGQRGSAMSAERSKGQRGSAMSSQRSKGQRGSAMSSERSRGGKNLPGGGSIGPGAKSGGGRVGAGHGGGKPFGGGGKGPGGGGPNDKRD